MVSANIINSDSTLMSSSPLTSSSTSEQPPSDQSTDHIKQSNGVVSNGTDKDTAVRMRNKTPQIETQTQAPKGDGATLSVLQRGLDALNEISPEVDDGAEEIRKLDSQLDHLNAYMGKVEERIKAHNDKLMDTLKHQKEEREKRRRSFHERLQQSQQEDDDFQRQLSSILNRVDISRNRASVYDVISNMEIPKVNGTSNDNATNGH